MPLRDVKLGRNVKIPYPELVNLYECSIGDGSFIGPFVEIQKGAKIGKNCRIQSHSFVCTGVTIKNNVFVSHGAVFINDKYPPHGRGRELGTTVEDNASIGSNATILPVRIGKNAVVGAGAVVTENVPKNCIVAGNPAKVIRKLK